MASESKWTEPVGIGVAYGTSRRLMTMGKSKGSTNNAGAGKLIKDIVQPVTQMFMMIIWLFSNDRAYLAIVSHNYPSLHYVFGMTCHMNSAPIPYLHHHHCRAQTIIFILFLPLYIIIYHPGLSTQTKMSYLQKFLGPTLTHTIIHFPALNDTHLN